MKPIIEFRDIGKKFRINRRQKPYVSLRENILECLKNPGIFFEKKEEFWALKDITLDVMPGESIGIIGKNGAGKTTLLKILSRITPPTTGEIKVRGRVASLLEVGTGFHPELTGRENIFFNGAILGMKRSEIRKKFDEIVDFAGVEKFIDTPLKHYSSGMQLRLAFAVAAFLEAEILVVDEVLAVGDAEFQKKCLGKMEDVTRNEGRTVLFVSHNMGIVRDLCKKIVFLEKGNLISYGSSDSVIRQYIKSIENNNIIFQAGNYLKKIYTTNSIGEVSNVFEFSEEIDIVFELFLPLDLRNTKFGFGIDNVYNQRLFSYYIDLHNFQGETKMRIKFYLPNSYFNIGRYYISSALIQYEHFLEVIENQHSFEIIENEEYYKKTKIRNYYGSIICDLKYDYEIKK